MLFRVPPPSAMLVYILLATWHLDIIVYMCYNIYIRLRNSHSGYILITLFMPHEMRLESVCINMPTFPNMPSVTEIAYVMMVIGYMVTIITIGRLLLNALEWAVAQLVILTTNLMERYAPKWLQVLDLKIQGWLALPAWISWKLDEMAVSALERTTNRFRAANDRKAAQLLVEMEDYNSRYYDVMSK